MPKNGEKPTQASFPLFNYESDPGKENLLLPSNIDQLNHKAFAPFDVSLLGLAAIQGLGAKGIKALFRTFDGQLGRAWNQEPETLKDVLEGARVPDASRIALEAVRDKEKLITLGSEELEMLKTQRNITLLHRDELPDSLKMIPDPPYWLFVQGNPKVLYRRQMVAIVGTRQPTETGLEAAVTVGQVAAPYELTIVSGLAEGIDRLAHENALFFKQRTLAFLGHGINVVFPASTRELRQQIVDLGNAVASEYLPNEHYAKQYFVERNRLQSGISDLVIAVEARLKSGTAHTVSFARKQRKPVIGLEWAGANGLLQEIRSNGSHVIDIFTHEGQRELDRLFQSLFTSGEMVTPLRALQWQAIHELAIRNITDEYLEQFIAWLRREAQKTPR